MPLLALAPASLQSLRSAVLECRGGDGVRALQEAGFATGDAMYDAMAGEMAAAGSPPLHELPAEDFAARLADFMRGRGWGDVSLAPDDSNSDARAIIVTVRNGAEARAAGGCEDGCPLTTGVLSGLLSRVVDAPVAVMAVETGGPADPLHCRFLAASPAAVQLAWQAMSDGRDWREALKG